MTPAYRQSYTCQSLSINVRATMLIILIVIHMCIQKTATAHISDVLEETEENTVNDLENTELDAGPVTEQIMQPNITINKPGESEVNDEEEQINEEPLDPDWDVNRAIRDIAYFLRAHKFHDYDRRYYKSIEDSPRHLYEEFPKPALRSMHWEVHKHCDNGFHHCLKYLERILRKTSLKREDDTVTVIKDHKWNRENHTEQILAAQRDCQIAQRRDNLTVAPFQGSIERFQWRTSASYYMCWYTMLETPELAVFGESCDNHANCLDIYSVNNRDPRANDDKPFACALYSFCPDHCCPMKHIWYMRDCFQSRMNPCYEFNRPADRKCSLNREDNQDLYSLMGNQINITCECREHGYEWSSRFGLCIDVNECTRGLHNCALEAGQSCINLPGNFDCVCSLGLVYNSQSRSCISSSAFERALQPEGAKDEESKKEEKSIFALIVKALTRSSSSSTMKHHDHHQQQRWAHVFILFPFIFISVFPPPLLL